MYFSVKNVPQIGSKVQGHVGSMMDNIGSFSTSPFSIPLFCDVIKMKYRDKRGLGTCLSFVRTFQRSKRPEFEWKTQNTSFANWTFLYFRFRLVTAPVFDFFYKIYRIRFRFETASKCVFNMAVPEDTGFPLMWFKNREFVRNTYECAVCLEVVKDAVQTCNCGHQFCRYCIDNVLK